jgi:glycosyltransferase involved in cell wall biosynthesis
VRLAHIVPSLEDRHGGPSKSVRALANGLAAQGESVELLTTAETDQREIRRPEDLATIHSFPRERPRWLTPSAPLQRHLFQTDFELVHNHALWLRPLHYARKAAERRRVPLVISPRGMLSGWAYAHRRWRKKLAGWLVHPGALRAAAGWHATSPGERDDIRALGFTQPVCVSPNGVPLPADHELAAARAAWHRLCPAAVSRPVAIFYSRFHRKKRLRELIDLWLAHPRGDWLLLVAGVAEEHTAAELSATYAGFADRVRVFDGAGRPPPYAIASLFLLPSHSENFGLVIAEALAAGVPALVTDTTPWSGLAAHDCGWCVAWDQYAATLAGALAIPPEELAQMGRRGRAWVAQEFSWARAAALLVEFYRQLRDERR